MQPQRDVDCVDKKVAPLLEKSAVTVIAECSGNCIKPQYFIAATLLTKYHKQTLNPFNN